MDQFAKDTSEQRDEAFQEVPEAEVSGPLMAEIDAVCGSDCRIATGLFRHAGDDHWGSAGLR